MALLHARAGAALQAQRILCQQIRRALRHLRGSGDEDIHEARKGIKQARATLRLLRRRLSRSDYRAIDELLRQAAKPLSAVRDARVMMTTLEGLLQRPGSAGAAMRAELLQRSLQRAHAQARRAATRHGGGVRQARRLLRRALDAMRRQAVGRGGWQALTLAAAERFGRARVALAEVRRQRSVETLHRWRKQTKQLYHQLELLAPLCPARVALLARALHTLSDELGDDHDLAVLQMTLAARARAPRPQAGGAALVGAIRAARARLQRRALARGARLFAPLPARFKQGLRG